jgi:hypothetical protein
MCPCGIPLIKEVKLLHPNVPHTIDPYPDGVRVSPKGGIRANPSLPAPHPPSPPRPSPPPDKASVVADGGGPS